MNKEIALENFMKKETILESYIEIQETFKIRFNPLKRTFFHSSKIWLILEKNLIIKK